MQKTVELASTRLSLSPDIAIYGTMFCRAVVVLDLSSHFVLILFSTHLQRRSPERKADWSSGNQNCRRG